MIDNPYRVVDNQHRGWVIHEPGPDPLYRCFVATAPPTQSGPFKLPQSPNPMALSDLRDYFGPLRVVQQPSEADYAAARQALRDADTRAIITAAYAVCITARIVADPHSNATTQRMVAGRPGSWESAILLQLVEDSEFTVPDSARAELPVQALVEILTRWVAAPDTYTEVAETLAQLLGPAIDEAAGPAAQDIDDLVNAGLAWPHDWTSGALNWLCSRSEKAHPIGH